MWNALAAVFAVLALLPAAALAQTGPSYQSYSNQAVWNFVDALNATGQGVKALFSGSRGESNAAFLGQSQANSSGNDTPATYASLLAVMVSDSQSQDDINYGFLALGNNASQIQCGDLQGPGANLGGTVSGAGNCKTNAGTKGISNVSRLKSGNIKSNFQGTQTTGARAIAALLRGGLSAMALTQKGTVAAINPFSN